ncbi:MAG TPA: 50S ribosomal protein L11 [Candidatus Dojkabacteria bacterium]|nr:50S ribosomal protein L11 [Candidatus Dojkabacteria bacterium]
MAIKGKKVKAILKLQLPAGKAVPGQQIGPALGQHGVNIGEFITQYNEKTRDQMGSIVPCVLTIFEDRSFKIELKTPPAAFLIKKAAHLNKGSATPNTTKVGKVKRSALKEIAQQKMADLNTNKLESAVKIIEGTAKSLGLEVTD